LAIYTVHEIVPRPDGTVFLNYDFELLGDNVKTGIAKKTGTSVRVYMEGWMGDSALWETLGFPAPMGRKSTGAYGSHSLGDCPTSETIKAPRTIELRPGERFVLAKCLDKTGLPTELYLFCDDR